MTAVRAAVKPQGKQVPVSGGGWRGLERSNAGRPAVLPVSNPFDRDEREAERLASSLVGAREVSLRDRSSLRPLRPIETRVEAEAGAGEPLPAGVRTFFEPRLRHDLSRVRVHSGDAAAAAATSFGARAFAVGGDVVFGRGQFAPDTPAGLELLAHELVHVVQQVGSPGHALQVQRARSYGVAGDDPRGVREEAGGTITVPPAESAGPTARESEQLPVPEESAEVRVARQPDTAAPPLDGRAPAAPGPAAPPAPTLDGRAPAGAAPPAPPAAPVPAAPTLSLAPGSSLTRGDQLTASVSFTPSAGQRLTVASWQYVTPALGTVSRPAGDPDFQTRWQEQMASSGELRLGYQITPSGGTAGPAQTISQAVTVNDRTGSPWQHALTEEAETPLAGQPSPPQQFNQLGRHESLPATPFPNPTITTIAAGPNAQFSFASTVTAGPFISRPHVHPNLTQNTSQFFRFHSDPSRLYLVVGATRTLIPLTEYSALSVAGGTLTFTVPNWEAFYKAHHFYVVTASGGGNQVQVRDAWWGLASNAQNASVEVRNEAAVRAALRLAPTDSYTVNWTSAGSWEGYQLMQAPAILTGTRSHEYVHAIHSHRANFKAMLRALDPQRKIESTVASPSNAVNFNGRITTWWNEILRPNHELVDESASRAQEQFVTASGSMAGVNVDPSSGAFLGSVWNITGDQQMT